MEGVTKRRIDNNNDHMKGREFSNRMKDKLGYGDVEPEE